MNKAAKYAQTLWNYHKLHQPIKKSDCIIALGNSDVRTAQKAADLFNQGFGDILVVTGGFGRLTKEKFSQPEAYIFANEAIKLGVPKEKIVIEDASTNTFDNIRFTKKALTEKGVSPAGFIIVTKPYMERRAIETFKSVWPNMPVQVTSPELEFDESPNQAISSELLIHMIVGDQQRLMIFSESGNVSRQDFPPEVIDAYDALVRLGYTKQIIPNENINNLLTAVSDGSKV